jgi:hypothetical protein
MGHGTNSAISIDEAGPVLAEIIVVTWKNAPNPVIVEMIEMTLPDRLQG